MAEYGASNSVPVLSRSKDSNKNNSFFNIDIFGQNKTSSLKVPLKVKLIFFRQLSVILKSGVPLSQGLDLLSENITSKPFANCIKDISSDLGSGIDLSSSLLKYSRVFERLPPKSK